MRIAINGGGIAGTTLAYWLHRFGHEPVLIEQAPDLRSGGYVIDFWGTGYEIADRMGLTASLEEFGYRVGEWRLVNARGRKTGGFPTSVFDRATGGRVISIERSTLARAIYATVKDDVEILFGDSIAGIDEKPDGITVSFDRHRPRDFDLVVGADGLHSRVRKLLFGPEEQFATDLGYGVGAFQVKGYKPRDELVYISHGEPGRQISRFSMRNDETLFLLVFHAIAPLGELPATDAGCKTVLREIFADAGWEAPQILRAMEESKGIYFDRVSQIRMGRWTKGRVALVGDAAAAVSLLAGEGTGLAMLEAYVLAGELSRAKGDHTLAFGRYENRLKPFILRKQDSARKFAASFAPATRFGLLLRDVTTRLMAIPFVANVLVRGMLDAIELPDYADDSR